MKALYIMSGNALHLRRIKSPSMPGGTMGGMSRFIANRSFIGVLMGPIFLATMIATSAAAGAQVADPVRLHKTVGGYRIHLVVEAILDPAIRNPRHSAGYEHRVTLTVRERKTGQRVQLAAATVDVAERGHPGPSYPLKSVTAPEGPAYETRVRMAVTGPYRLVVQATPQATGRVLKAQFDYRHHH